MDRYVNYLLADIQKIIDNPPQKPFVELPESYEELREIIEWEHAPRKPMCEWFGLEKEVFPPDEKLSDKNIYSLIKALTTLWESFNLYPDLPENLPKRLTYNLMVSSLDEEVAFVNEGRTWISFCDYNEDNCPFPEEYCMCKKANDGSDLFDDNFLPLDELGSNDTVISWLESEMARHKPDFDEKNILIEGNYAKADYAIVELINARKKAEKKYWRSECGDIQALSDAFEIVSAPYQTLPVLTGISQNILPQGISLHNYYVCKLLVAIYQLMESYRIDLIYPSGVPPQIFYMYLTGTWDTIMAQHLKDTGFDLSLCSEDTSDCFFADYCHCEEFMKEVLREEEEAMKRQDPSDDEDSDINNPFDDEELPF